MMSKRKSEGSSQMPNNRPLSPDTETSSYSSDDQLFFSSSSSSSIISYSSNVTTEDNVQSANSRVAKAMVLVGCRRCYMYVISSEVDPKCPKCENTVFFDLFKEDNLKTDK